MIKDIILPNLGEGIDSAEISEVVVKKGGIVSPDDIILVLESEKASMEIPAEVAGEVKEVMVKTGEEVVTGQILVKIELSQTQIEKEPYPENDENNKSIIETPSNIASKPEAIETLSKGSDSLFASPGVRRLSRELGINLELIRASGPKGRITKNDLHDYIKRKLAIAESGFSLSHSRPDVDFSQWGDVELKKLTKINLITGKRLQDAWQSIPHVTQFGSADITELDLYRKNIKEKALKKNIKVTFLPFFMKAVTHVLKEMPIFNSSLDQSEKNLVTKYYYHLGIAVDTPQGLTVPVIRNVDKKSILELSEELMDIGSRAINKKLKPDELKGGTFTISNLGSIGGSFFTPIINPPEVAILGVSRSNWELVYDNNSGEFIPRYILPFSLSYDHMVIDGAAGAVFTSKFSSVLANIDIFSAEK
ncbi:MAG: branched-chain alpha-keto acid dehydrogenase subunit E2 [Candidatus Marinimicrobia bacterium]|nr:branched-chain alpha-keto acid dehydrogenase subunit E2 [Candidatus Neomarinimicrobiota bacterium]|tara:strand:+ start:16312 stop:17574 length:1263 start_codon:yes stop_codon:yes gene_type:complete